MVDEGFDAMADRVADGPDMVEILACGVVQDPVLVAFAGIVGAGVAAPHGDYDVGGFDGLRGQDLGSFGGNVDTFFGHGLDGDGIDLVGGFGTGRAYLDLAAGQLTEIAGGYLVNAGILTREQRGKWAYYRLVPGALDVLAALITSPEV